MKTVWIIVFSILGIMNFFKLFKDLYTIYRDEKNKFNNNKSCHEKCYFIDSNNCCDYFVAKIYWRLKKADTNCKGASGCSFYLNKDTSSGEIKNLSFFHLITNTITSSIGTITLLALSIFELFDKLK